MPRRTWTREKIVAAIRARASRGLSVNCSRVKREAIALYSAACYYFRSWASALEAAGFRAPPRYPKWDKAELTQILRRLSKNGRFVGGRLLDRESARIGRDLRGATRRKFGTLRAARAELGLTPNPEPRIWPRRRVIAEIRKLARHGRLRHSEALRLSPRLPGAINRCFGGWIAGLRAAGVEAGSKWARPVILRALRSAWRKRDIRVNSLKERLGSGIYPSAVREFGSWRSALQAAGVPSWAYATRMSARRALQEAKG